MELHETQDKAAVCEKCSLYKTRKVPVFAKGSSYSKIMICGMCPGPAENSIINEAGVPFIGRAGKLLDVALIDSKLTLKDVYITNLIKCFLKPGFKLEAAWVKSCFPYLIAQIEATKPVVILALGGDAGRVLLNKPSSTSLTSMRGKRHKFTDKISIIVTYHPSYLVRLGGKTHRCYKEITNDLSWCKEIAESKGGNSMNFLSPNDSPVHNSISDTVDGNFGGNREFTTGAQRKDSDYKKPVGGDVNEEQNPIDETVRDIDEMTESAARKREFSRRAETNKCIDHNTERFHETEPANRPPEDTDAFIPDDTHRRSKLKDHFGEGQYEGEIS